MAIFQDKNADISRVSGKFSFFFRPVQYILYLAAHKGGKIEGGRICSPLSGLPHVKTPGSNRVNLGISLSLIHLPIHLSGSTEFNIGFVA